METLEPVYPGSYADLAALACYGSDDKVRYIYRIMVLYTKVSYQWKLVNHELSNWHAREHSIFNQRKVAI